MARLSNQRSLVRTSTGVLAAAALVAASFAAGGSDSSRAAPQEALKTAGVEIPIPPGFSKYCSRVNPHLRGPGRRWGFATGTDPCAVIPGSTRGAGLMSVSQTNTVIARCGPTLGNLNHVIAFKGRGSGPTTSALNEATRTNLRYCEFKVAPKSLPIFTSLFDLDPLPKGMTFHHYVPDFAGADGGDGGATLDVTSFGRRPVGSGANTSDNVDYKGFDRRGQNNQHMAFDITLGNRTPLLALADGEVVFARGRPVSTQNCGSAYYSPLQGEIAIKHTVGSLDSPYYEQFIVGYAHVQLSTMRVKTGDTVRGGDVIAYSSRTGCSSGQYHLHYSVERTTNTARHWHFDYRGDTEAEPTNTGHNGRAAIDPFGWRAPQGIDPQGYLYYNTPIGGRTTDGSTVNGGGAMSIRLWKTGHAHPRPCDESSTRWRHADYPVRILNPLRNCP